MAPREEQAELFGCLEDETLDRLFLAGFVAGPLSPETSECVREIFEVIDPRTVMTAGIEGDPGRAMAGSMAAFMVTTACLNDEEWEETSRMTAMSSGEREDARCLMSALGGPGQMAEAMTAAGEGDFAALAEAGETCGLDMGPPPRAIDRYPDADTHGDHGGTDADCHGDDTRVHADTDADEARQRPPW